MQREKKREFPNPEELTALLQKIDAELAIRRTKMDTSRLLGYQIEDLDIRRYICMHVLSYLDIMEKEMVEFWLECIRYDGSYDFSMSKALERILNTVFRPKLRAAKKKEGSDHVQS